MTTVSWLSICFLPVRWKWPIWRFQTFWRGSDSFGSLELFCFRDFSWFLELFELFELCKKSLKIFSAFLNFLGFRPDAHQTNENVIYKCRRRKNQTTGILKIYIKLKCSKRLQRCWWRMWETKCVVDSFGRFGHEQLIFFTLALGTNI